MCIKKLSVVVSVSKGKSSYVPAPTSSVLTDLHERIRTCTLCPLHETRTHAVPGCCNPHSRILFVGEAPGRREDEMGLPFVGRAGTLLDELLFMIGLSREEVFITSILKCRPPGNRMPRLQEISSCTPYLMRQIEAIDPRLICALGSVAKRFFDIKSKRGTPFQWEERAIVPTYHPAAALYNPALRKALEADFRLIRGIMDTL